MSTYKIPAPQPMSLKGDVVKNWKEFENSWDYYLIATNLRAKMTTAEGEGNMATSSLGS